MISVAATLVGFANIAVPETATVGEIVTPPPVNEILPVEETPHADGIYFTKIF